MSSRAREVELTISSAKKIKNVNWRNGPNRPYAIVWVDPKNKCSTRVDEEGDTSPTWNERLVIPLPPDNNDDEDKLFIDIVHAGQEEDTKPLIGSAKLSLQDVLKEVGFGVPFVKTLKLKRPSGRPHGKLDVTVTVLGHNYDPTPRSYQDEPYRSQYAPPQPDYGGQYAPPQPDYGSQYPPQQYQYGGSPSGGYSANEQQGYEQKQEKEESKFGGMGMGLAIGAVGGVLGGIALAEGYDALTEDNEEETAEKEEDKDSGDDSDGGDDSD